MDRRKSVRVDTRRRQNLQIDVSNPLPRDLLLPLVNHFYKLSDQKTLHSLSLLDKSTNNRVNVWLYKTVRLTTPHALVSFFSYFTGQRITRSKLALGEKERAPGEEVIGKRQAYLIGLIRHMEVRLDAKFMKGEWQKLVGKLSLKRALDKGFPNGILDNLDTLHLTSFGELYRHKYATEATSRPRDLDYSIAYIFAKCSAANTYHFDDIARHYTYSVVGEGRTTYGRQLSIKVVKDRLAAKPASYQSSLFSGPVWQPGLGPTQMYDTIRLAVFPDYNSSALNLLLNVAFTALCPHPIGDPSVPSTSTSTPGLVVVADSICCAACTRLPCCRER
jgi:hypothetical protein